MRPFKLQPAFKDYLWGGTRLKTDFGKNAATEIVAESWELSAHPDGPATILGGEFAGRDFRSFIAAHPQAMGTAYAGVEEFPVLVKLIDAAKPLSVQVHPDEQYAQRVEGEHGKTEMWVVLDAAPGAFLYLGFAAPITKEEMRRRIENDTLAEVLHKAPCQKGDVFFIPAGTIHAIGAGLLIAEIQQSSNSTYRVYDYGRVGADGKPRQLHIQKALDVTQTRPADDEAPGRALLAQTHAYRLERLAACPHFTTLRLTLNGEYGYTVTPDSYAALLCTSGALGVENQGQALPLALGETVFLPAGCGLVTITGAGEALLVTK